MYYRDRHGQVAPMTPVACICFRLRRAAREVSQRYDRALAPVGLSLNEYSILRRLVAAPRVLGDFAAELGMDRSTLTRNARPLIDAGLLREARGEDARQRVIAITAAGKRRLAQAKPRWERAQLETQALIGVAMTTRINNDLDALHARFAENSGLAA
jgi:DNA-binding MarR family transcriptional regulator